MTRLRWLMLAVLIAAVLLVLMRPMAFWNNSPGKAIRFQFSFNVGAASVHLIRYRDDAPFANRWEIWVCTPKRIRTIAGIRRPTP